MILSSDTWTTDTMQGPIKRARRHQKRMLKQVRKNMKQQDKAYRNATLSEKGQGPPGLGIVSGLIDTVGNFASSFFGGGASAAAGAATNLSQAPPEEMSGGINPHVAAPAVAVCVAVAATYFYHQQKVNK